MLHALIAAVTLTLAQVAVPAETPQPDNSGKLADRAFLVTTDRGSGEARYFGSGSLDGDATVTRALIVVHGVLRDADYYYDTGVRAVSAARLDHVLVIAPQFVEKGDIAGQGVPADTLYWAGGWPGGSDALAPAPISTYDVFDAMLARLADRSRFPALQEITIAGHSAGGQIVQRYAVVGNAPQLDAKSTTPVHLIVSNPSSYFYFDDWRPSPQRNCADFDKWRYGIAGAPRYVTGGIDELEARYVQRHVTYLLGTADTNPREDDLDQSCGGEAQGPYRYARGKNFIAYLHKRHPDGSAQDYAFVRGVGHQNREMFTSACGLATLFGPDVSSCADAGKV
jgi:pimeloyl-ACP methyl ester carboxylesterase